MICQFFLEFIPFPTSQTWNYTRKSCSETNTKAALRYRQSALFKFDIVFFHYALAIMPDF